MGECLCVRTGDLCVFKERKEEKKQGKKEERQGPQEADMGQKWHFRGIKKG